MFDVAVLKANLHTVWLIRILKLVKLSLEEDEIPLLGRFYFVSLKEIQSKHIRHAFKLFYNLVRWKHKLRDH